MLEGTFAEQTFLFDEQRAFPPMPQETDGVSLGSQPIYRYSLKSSDYPTIIIIEKISDGMGNIIEPGHYEIALSDDMKFFIIMQTKQPVAIVPVFKVEEDKSAYKTSKELDKIKKKKAKEIEKTNKKRAKAGLPLEELEKLYMEASLEYVKDGNYYLIKYERGTIRAWGAIKAD